MKLYGGMDLHSTNVITQQINEEDKVIQKPDTLIGWPRNRLNNVLRHMNYTLARYRLCSEGQHLTSDSGHLETVTTVCFTASNFATWSSAVLPKLVGGQIPVNGQFIYQSSDSQLSIAGMTLKLNSTPIYITELCIVMFHIEPYPMGYSTLKRSIGLYLL